MSKANDTVWVSRAMADTRLAKYFKADLSINDVKLAIEVKRKNEAGEPLPAECFPKEFYYDYRNKKEKNYRNFLLQAVFLCFRHLRRCAAPV